MRVHVLLILGLFGVCPYSRLLLPLIIPCFVHISLSWACIALISPFFWVHFLILGLFVPYFCLILVYFPCFGLIWILFLPYFGVFSLFWPYFGLIFPYFGLILPLFLPYFGNISLFWAYFGLMFSLSGAFLVLVWGWCWAYSGLISALRSICFLLSLFSFSFGLSFFCLCCVGSRNKAPAIWTSILILIRRRNWGLWVA